MPPPLTEAERNSLRGSLMTLRIIVFSLAMGVASFGAYSIFNQSQKPAPAAAPNGPAAAQPNQIPVLHLMGCAFGVGAGVLAFLVPPFLRLPSQNAETPDERNPAIQAASQMVQTRTIVACALIEAAAFFNLVWYFTDASVLNLAMGGLLLVLLMMHFPLTGSYYERVEKLLGVDPFAAKWQSR
jgi:hypothetical protein